ncbi:MAG: N-acetylmuramoyl-L-alanine amidase [Phycisphaerales bacterium]
MHIRSLRGFLGLSLAAVAVVLAGCSTPGKLNHRKGDEIVAAGQLFHIGTPVVLWMDPGGYDAYRVEKRFVPYDESLWEVIKDKVDSPNRYSLRYKGKHFSPEVVDQIKGGGWPLPLLQDTVDQFVIHYDVCGTSKQCFNILHDHRTLSVHFMLDVDGTIYQTLDLKERAWHASQANDRSVGIEIANMGAYPANKMDTLKQWYKTNDDGTVELTIPESRGDGGVRKPGFKSGPIRNELVTGTINGAELNQYDLTPEQYKALIKLTAALEEIFPKIKNDYPRDADGNLRNNALSDEEFADYQGLIGHYHITTGKSDPGPAFQWDYLIDEVKKEKQGWRVWR